MAKMFYTIEEAAERLGVTPDEVKAMVEREQLTEYRDRDRLMFKVDQVDALSANEKTDVSGDSMGMPVDLMGDDETGDSSDVVSLDDTAMGSRGPESTEATGSIDYEQSQATGSIELEASSGAYDPEGSQDTGDLPLDQQVGTGSFVLDEGGSSGAFSLEDSASDAAGLGVGDQPGGDSPKEDSRQQTGVSVFDADEVESADPMAQTQVTTPAIDEEELALDTIGSGSGLLDLTRESDDTSLGAELLDEIYPGGERSDANIEEGGAVGSATNVFDDSSIEVGSGASGLEQLQPVEPAPGMAMAAAEPMDPAGSGFGAGMLMGAFAALVLGMMVAVSGVADARIPLIDGLAANLPLYAGLLLIGSIIFGVVGLFLGKAFGR